MAEERTNALDPVALLGGEEKIAGSVWDAIKNVDDSFQATLAGVEGYSPLRWLKGLTRDALLHILYVKGVALQDIIAASDQQVDQWWDRAGRNTSPSIGSNSSELPLRVAKGIRLRLAVLDQICLAPKERTLEQREQFKKFRDRLQEVQRG
jgi:hypothetical protein